MGYCTLHPDVDCGVPALRLHRPERINTIAVAMADELLNAHLHASDNYSVRFTNDHD